MAGHFGPIDRTAVRIDWRRVNCVVQHLAVDRWAQPSAPEVKERGAGAWRMTIMHGVCVTCHQRSAASALRLFSMPRRHVVRDDGEREFQAFDDDGAARGWLGHAVPMQGTLINARITSVGFMPWLNRALAAAVGMEWFDRSLTYHTSCPDIPTHPFT